VFWKQAPSEKESAADPLPRVVVRLLVDVVTTKLPGTSPGFFYLINLKTKVDAVIICIEEENKPTLLWSVR
jgi:hypothetical protein